VSRGKRGQVLWEAVGGVGRNATPLAVMHLPEVVAMLLRERGPLRLPDIVLGVQAKGYRADADYKTLLDSVRAMLRRCTDRFACEDGRWSMHPS
jgi:hypothetical protein